MRTFTRNNMNWWTITPEGIFWLKDQGFYDGWWYWGEKEDAENSFFDNFGYAYDPDTLVKGSMTNYYNDVCI